MRAARSPAAGFALALTLAVTWATAADPPPALRRQSFDSDPNWDAFRSRLTPAKPHVVRQQFGYRPTNKAGGKRPGEIGGWVQRSIAPAYYAVPVERRSFEDKLSFSGRFAVHRDESSTGTLVGFFNGTASRGWRTAHPLARSAERRARKQGRGPRPR